MNTSFRTLSLSMISFFLGGALLAGELEIFPTIPQLDFAASSESRQLVVTQDGKDVTSHVQYQASPEGLILLSGLQKTLYLM